MNLAHTLGDLREMQRRVSALRLNGIDSELLTTEEVKKILAELAADGFLEGSQDISTATSAVIYDMR